MSKRYPGVKRLPNGKVEIRFTAYRDGKRIDRIETLPESTTMTEAVARRAERMREVQAALEEAAPRRNQNVTLTVYTRSWLAERAPSMKPTARDNYATAFTLHILPVIGHIPVRELVRADVQRWVSWAEGATYVPRTWGEEPSEARLYSRAAVLSWWAKVRQVCKDAAADYGIADPTLRVQPPKCIGRELVREQRTLSGDELRSLLDAIPTAWHPEVYTLSVTGMRPGELYALTWADVDLDHRNIRVARSHHMGAVGTTKTGATRHLPITPALAEILRAHRMRQVREQHPALVTGLVFPSSDDARGWHRIPQSLRTVLDRAARAVRLDVHVTPQVLRRTVNTLLVELNVDRLVVRDITGHSSEQMTALYHASRVETRADALRGVEAEIVGPDCGTTIGLKSERP